MSIQFSGLGSGLPIDDWIKALVKAKQDKIDTLTTKQQALQAKSNTLSSLNTIYSGLKTTATKFTDTLLGPSSDFFSSISVTSSEDGKDKKSVTASVTNLSTPSEFDITVEKLASKTKITTDSNAAWKKSSSKLSELGITQEGTLKINDAEIQVKPDMTVDELVYKISSAPGSGVNAYLKGGSLVFENKETGATEIYISGEGAVNDSGQTVDELLGLNKESNKTLGNNAIYTLNGEQKESTTNKLTSADTGIVGLSIELKGVTTDPVTLKIGRNYDTSSAETALEEFITNFNKAISQTDKETQSSGSLYGENQLTYIRNNLRTMITNTVGFEGKYKSLADIGISTGAAGLDVSADTTQLVFDKEKFQKAFEEDPEAVKALLVGDQTKGTTGVMQNLQTALEPALDSTNGYFKARTDSLSSEISNMSNTISKKNDELEIYEANLQKQYNYMDQMIAKMNQQFEYMKQQLSSLFGDS